MNKICAAAGNTLDGIQRAVLQTRLADFPSAGVAPSPGPGVHPECASGSFFWGAR